MTLSIFFYCCRPTCQRSAEYAVSYGKTFWTLCKPCHDNLVQTMPTVAPRCRELKEGELLPPGWMALDIVKEVPGQPGCTVHRRVGGYERK